jgi:hypothetical protein
MNKYRSFFINALLTVSLIALSTTFFANKGIQGINWTFPYFSGAANYERLFDWKISPSDFEQVKTLTLSDYRIYKHQRSTDLIQNFTNNYGYVLIALTSQKLFPYLGDIQGLILLQVLVHVLACLFLVLMILKTPIQRFGFILLYAANPLIIHFVTFPFYYFWLFIPSFCFTILMLKPTWRRYIVIVSPALLLFSLLIRPTTVFLSIMFFLVAFFFLKTIRDKITVIVAFGVFVVILLFIEAKHTGAPWHTAYVGIGAYSNDVGVTSLADEQGFEFFYNKTGILINTDAVHGNYNDQAMRQQYMETLRARYSDIAKEKYGLLIRNALVNLLQVYSIGYITEKPILTWISTGLGAIVFLFLLCTHQWNWAVAIFASASSFVFYYPPIPAYNFAAYMLLVVSGMLGLERVIVKLRTSHRT